MMQDDQKKLMCSATVPIMANWRWLYTDRQIGEAKPQEKNLHVHFKEKPSPTAAMQCGRILFPEQVTNSS
jgi:hypothetical protein